MRRGVLHERRRFKSVGSNPWRAPLRSEDTMIQQGWFSVAGQLFEMRECAILIVEWYRANRIANQIDDAYRRAIGTGVTGARNSLYVMRSIFKDYRFRQRLVIISAAFVVLGFVFQ